MKHFSSKPSQLTCEAGSSVPGARSAVFATLGLQLPDTLLNRLNVINQILIEANKLELRPTDFALAEFLRIVADIIGVKAEQKNLDFVCDLAPDLPHAVRADEQRLRQVLLNLLSNGVKFTDHGQVMLRVRSMPPARLRFEVQDTGVGIDQKQLGAIFQPFEQVGEMQRRVGGTGLGLAIRLDRH